jgi:hypothetical protein
MISAIAIWVATDRNSIVRSKASGPAAGPIRPLFKNPGTREVAGVALTYGVVAMGTPLVPITAMRLGASPALLRGAHFSAPAMVCTVARAAGTGILSAQQRVWGAIVSIASTATDSAPFPAQRKF